MNCSLTIKFNGLNLGTISGDPHRGIILSIDLLIEKGSLTFHLTDSDELTMTVQLTGILNESKDINISKL
jgi:hypothetical protein